MKEYIHKVKYYETDKMGITQNSNNIRWMEEARINFLEQNYLSKSLNILKIVRFVDIFINILFL